ncbi:MAG: hypothetical protein N3H30_01125 [Candidatus Micrarchaeota archaeon]|nr:hypothetical protein [Candidatus Micrarchaeota archaeon]
MAKTAALLALLLANVVAFASCSINSYTGACDNCPFDEKGKMDRACLETYKSGGLACISAKYPIMSAKYSAGDCPAVSECADELSSCIAGASSGNDKEDCRKNSVMVCYANADRCIERASVKCGETETPCLSSLSLVLFILGAGLFAHLSRR